jgi:hypothetical protein
MAGRALPLLARYSATAAEIATLMLGARDRSRNGISTPPMKDGDLHREEGWQQTSARDCREPAIFALRGDISVTTTSVVLLIQAIACSGKIREVGAQEQAGRGGSEAITRGGRSSAHVRHDLGLPAEPSSAAPKVADEVASRGAAATTGATLAGAAPGDVPEVNEGFWAGSPVYSGSSAQAIGCCVNTRSCGDGQSRSRRGKAGAALGLALGLGLIAAKERGLPFVSDLEDWLLGGEGQPAEFEQQPQQPTRRTSIGPAAIWIASTPISVKS